MDINNLKKEWFKDKKRSFKYKELSDILKEKQKSSGKSRNYQFQNWKRYFDFYKPNLKGQKFIITEIYDNPKSKVDGRKIGKTGLNPNSHNNQNGLYGKYIDKILSHFFAINDDEFNSLYYCTTSKLAIDCCMVNINYSIAKKERIKFYHYLKNKNSNISTTEVKDVLDVLYDTIRSAINSSLNRLQKQNVISYTRGYIVLENNESRLATPFEEIEIKTLEDNILKEMNIEKNNLRFNFNKIKNFYNELDKRIKDKYTYIQRIWQGYKIINKKTKQLNDKEYIKLTQELNKTITSEAINKFNNKKEKSYKKVNNCLGLPKDLEHQDKWDKDRLQDCYISNTTKILKILTQLKAKNIIVNINNTIVPINNKDKVYEDFINRESKGDPTHKEWLRQVFPKDNILSYYKSY